MEAVLNCETKYRGCKPLLLSFCLYHRFFIITKGIQVQGVDVSLKEALIISTWVLYKAKSFYICIRMKYQTVKKAVDDAKTPQIRG